ncbi:MAG: sulfatase-like hydrolase/transferase, partial [Phycisphaerae bacterium]|nr:sulfatase-like hydrolase/transferase [Phycisphaerae bacterium]
MLKIWFRQRIPRFARHPRAAHGSILFGAALIACSCAPAPAADRPNILFLFADDQRPDTISALGNPAIKTPNLDALVRRGTAFTNAYCMGSTSGAVCNPSRHQTLSGMSLFRYKKKRPSAAGTFGEVFTQAGYETYHQSKNGNTAKVYHRGFTHSSYLNDGGVRRSGHHGKSASDTAIAFIEGNKWDRTKPLLMYIGFAGPHDPRVAAEQWKSLYSPKQIPLPVNYQPFHPLNNGEMFVRDEKLAPWPRTKDVVRRHLHDYYACISSLDFHIGRILQALDDAGELKNTIVVFSADHGLAVGSHGLFGKQNLYEHSMGAPLIFAGPGVPHGRSEAFAYLFDIFPTVADMAGVKYPGDLDGQSLAGVIRGEKSGVRDTVFLAYKSGQRAVRRGRWKLYRFPLIDRNLLFDLEADPHEMRDLAGDSAQADRVRKMMDLLAKQQKAYDDPNPLTVAKPGRAEVDLAF